MNLELQSHYERVFFSPTLNLSNQSPTYFFILDGSDRPRSLCIAAAALKMHSLVTQVFDEMVTRSNFTCLLAELLDNLFLSGGERLKSYTLNYAKSNFETVSTCTSWPFISITFLRPLLSAEDLNLGFKNDFENLETPNSDLNPEIMVFNALCSWLNGCRTHLASAAELLKLIKLKLFSARQLTELVEEKDYFKNDSRCYMQYLEVHKCHSLRGAVILGNF